MLIQGECAIGTALTYQVVTEINNGYPLKIIFPPEGSPYCLNATSMIKGRERNEVVVEVFDYLVNVCLVEDIKKFNPGRILVSQESDMENYPEDIKYADMKNLSDYKLKEELLKKWKY